ncbi:hypothetical protein TrLO_g9930 [Triparma laevis f. longispina]|uniref:PPM-type phosphatase domain-containing protein n=1 Tax=Triparma laevis f. longispina TaxID=1714387 RepID=A0A9W7A4A0_9STRA|nr:hypothetical protein TrLO_g9930 [Triparma laevis f. longispina]
MGTLLDKPVIEKEGVEKGTANNLTFGVASMQGWRVDMEDSHYYNGTLGDEVPGVSIFAVFDGHGGQFAAKYAAEHIERILKEQEKYKEYVTSKDPVVLGDALKACFIEIDVQMLKTPTMSEKKDRSGCTAVCVCTTPTHIICSNAGDSRSCYLKAGIPIDLSFDHKPYNPAESARIENAGGYVSMKRVDGDLAVSRALGDFQYKDRPDLPAEQQKVTGDPEIIIKERSPTEDEFILIACDGIWDVCSNQEACDLMSDILKEGETDPALMSEEMLDLCLEKGSRDNMTCGVVLFSAAKMGGEGGGVAVRRAKREEEAKAQAMETEGEEVGTD